MDKYTLAKLMFPGSHNSLIMDLEIKKKEDRKVSIYTKSTPFVNSKKSKRKKTSITEGIVSYLNPEVCPYKMFEFNLQTIELCKFFPFCIELDLILEKGKCLFGHLNNKCEFSIEEFLTDLFKRYIELNAKKIYIFPLIITLDFKKTRCFCKEFESCCSIIGKILTKVIEKKQKEFVEVSAETRNRNRNKKHKNEVSDLTIDKLFNKIIFRLKKSEGDFIDFFETNNIIYINNSGGLSHKFKNNSSKKVKLKYLKKSNKKVNSITRLYPSNLPTRLKPYKHYRPNNLSLLYVLISQLNTSKNIFDGNQYHNIISFDFDRIFLNSKLFMVAKKYFLKLATLYNQFLNKIGNNIIFDNLDLESILDNLHRTITQESVKINSP